MTYPDKNIQVLLEKTYDEVLRDSLVRTVLFLTDDVNPVRDTVSDFIAQKKGATCRRRSVNPRDSFTPFYPFLNWIEESALEVGLSVKKIISESDIYYPFRPVFESFFLKKPAAREEELILEELDFEKKKLNESVASVFTYVCSGKPTIAVIDGVQHLPESTLELLCHLNASRLMPLLIILIHNKNELHSGENARPRSGSLSAALETGSVLVDVRTHDGLSSVIAGRIPFPEMPVEAEVELLAGNILFNSFDDAALIADHLSTHMNLMPVPADEKAHIHILSGDVHYYRKKNEQAIIHYQSALTLAVHSENVRVLQFIYRRLAQAYFSKHDIDNAMKYIFLSLKLCEKSGDELELFYTLFHLLVIDGKENRVLTETWITYFRRMIILAEELGLRNALAFCLTFHDRFDPVDNRPEISEMIDRAIELSSEIGNTMRLASAYHAKGLFFIYNDEYSKVKYFYAKAEELTVKIGNNTDIARLCNGFGYFSLQTGDYKNAETYMIRAFEYSCYSKDYHEIAMAICNIAFNYMMCQEFETAKIYFEHLLVILKKLGISELPYHSRFGIYSMTAVCYYKTGRISKFLEYYTFIRSNLLEKESHARLQNYTEEMLHYILITAFYNKIRGNFPEAENSLIEGAQFIRDKYSLIKYLSPFFDLECGRFYLESGNRKKALDTFTAGRDAAAESGNVRYEAVLAGLCVSSAVPVRMLDSVSPLIDFDKVIDMADVSQSMQLMTRRIEELDFLYLFANMITSIKNETELIASAGRLYVNSFNFDVFLLQKFDSDSTQMLYCQTGLDKNSELYRRFLDLADTSRARQSSLVTADMGSEHGGEFSSVVSIPLATDKGWSLHLVCASLRENPVLTENEFVILDISFRQLVSALVKIIQDKEIKEKNRMLEDANRQLYDRATTDSLTRLFNRQSLMQRMREQQERNKRRLSEMTMNDTILYVDLDNFKYFNDTFGHRIGDSILIAFGVILKKSIRTCDYASRFGGDEFVILLPQTTIDNGIVIAERILSSMEESSSFISMIESNLGKGIVIPDNKKLTCSIGISSSPEDIPADMQALLGKAESALSRAKAEGKNRYCIE
jgi:diguanylate cyclase (GGDEF)-like protein